MKNELNKENTMWLRLKTKINKPTLYKVILHNDEFTPMEFVVGILEKFFYMDRQNATEIMLEAHVQGQANCGIFTKDIAESKISQAVDYARVHEHPLRYSMESV